MQNFILTYKLRNPFSMEESYNLIIDKELFREKTSLSSTSMEFNNHIKPEFINGLEKCKELVLIILNSFDIDKDINKLSKNSAHLMLSEIVITVKLNDNPTLDECLTFKNDFKILIGERNKMLEEIYSPTFKILSGLRRRIGHFEWFDLIEKEVCKQTYVYAIVNNRNSI